MKFTNEELTRRMIREVSGLYVCDACGLDEALRVVDGCPLPLEQWDQTRLINTMYK